MTHYENLIFAVGEFAYAIALADGKMKRKERLSLYHIFESEFNDEQYDFAEIILQILRKDQILNLDYTYRWALNELNQNSQYLTPGLKKKFLRIINKVQELFPSSTIAESALIENFKQEISLIEATVPEQIL